MLCNKIILLEINEIPLSVISAYSKDSRYKHLNKFITESQFIPTLSSDQGDLSPWVTWPTVHRGINGDAHGIKNLGQDPSTFRGTTIWEEFRALNLSIGIFGSLQSWPPIDPGKGGFFVPDTFASDESCYPKKLEPIQKFNLDNVKKNSRVLSKSTGKLMGNLKILIILFKNGLSLKSSVRLVLQLMLEKIDKRFLARRPIFQTIILFDIFKHLCKRNELPAFTTFFTNHIAGVMHRYWDKIFIDETNRFYEQSFHKKYLMDFSIKILDEIIEFTFKVQKSHPNTLTLFASSMGQELTKAGEHDGKEALIKDLKCLLKFLGINDDDFKELLAMAPQKTFEIYDETKRNGIAANLQKFITSSNRSIFNVDIQGKSITVTLHNPTSQERVKELTYDSIKLSWSDLGIDFVNIEQNSAYHIPEGVLYINGLNIDLKESLIYTDQIKNTILSLALNKT